MATLLSPLAGARGDRAESRHAFSSDFNHIAQSVRIQPKPASWSVVAEHVTPGQGFARVVPGLKAADLLAIFDGCDRHYLAEPAMARASRGAPSIRPVVSLKGGSIRIASAFTLLEYGDDQMLRIHPRGRGDDGA